jgi:pyruvoyl-dependent arginine decarboxylase (PvlArgDC)
MVKPKVAEETSENRFKRIATSRTIRILNDIRLLGNCSNTRSYSYTKEETDRIFSTIEKEMKRVKTMFDKPKTEFSLK